MRRDSGEERRDAKEAGAEKPSGKEEKKEEMPEEEPRGGEAQEEGSGTRTRARGKEERRSTVHVRSELERDLVMAWLHGFRRAEGGRRRERGERGAHRASSGGSVRGERSELDESIEEDQGLGEDEWKAVSSEEEAEEEHARREEEAEEGVDMKRVRPSHGEPPPSRLSREHTTTHRSTHVGSTLTGSPALSPSSLSSPAPPLVSALLSVVDTNALVAGAKKEGEKMGATARAAEEQQKQASDSVCPHCHKHIEVCVCVMCVCVHVSVGVCVFVICVYSSFLFIAHYTGPCCHSAQETAQSCRPHATEYVLDQLLGEDARRSVHKHANTHAHARMQAHMDTRA